MCATRFFVIDVVCDFGFELDVGIYCLISSEREASMMCYACFATYLQSPNRWFELNHKRSDCGCGLWMTYLVAISDTRTLNGWAHALHITYYNSGNISIQYVIISILARKCNRLKCRSSFTSNFARVERVQYLLFKSTNPTYYTCNYRSALPCRIIVVNSFDLRFDETNNGSHVSDFYRNNMLIEEEIAI